MPFAGEDEQFILKLINRPILILRGENGYVCHHKNSNTLDANRSIYDIFTLQFSDGAYHIKGECLIYLTQWSQSTIIIYLNHLADFLTIKDSRINLNINYWIILYWKCRVLTYSHCQSSFQAIFMCARYDSYRCRRAVLVCVQHWLGVFRWRHTWRLLHWVLGAWPHWNKGQKCQVPAWRPGRHTEM